MAIAKVLADFYLAVWYGIAIRIYVSKKFWREVDRQKPNLILHQIFQLYGIILMLNHSVMQVCNYLKVTLFCGY